MLSLLSGQMFLSINYHQHNKLNSNEKKISKFCHMSLKGPTVFVPIPAHTPITAHQCHFQFQICGTINHPLKSSHPVGSDYVSSPVLNTENHQLTLC